MITYTHSLGLALASIAVSIVASITALAMMNELRQLPEAKRKAVVVMSAFVLGIGIWSMHFLAMLALRFSVPIHYDLLQTLSSGLIAVLVVGFALLLLHFWDRTETVLNIAGLALGVGIVAMHFVGMLGMRGVIPEFSKLAIVASIAVALITGVAAIRVSYGLRSRLNIVKGGFMFGLSVVVVHHTAMLGTQFGIDPEYTQRTFALDQDVLAIVVTVAAFVISGSFLLAASTFVPKDNHAAARPDNAGVANTGSGIAAITTGASDATTNTATKAATRDTTPALTPEANSFVGSAGIASGGNRAIDAPFEKTSVEQAGVSIVRSESVKKVAEGSSESALGSAPERAAVYPPVKIPYEENKRIIFVPSDEVATIRADGRYTQLYTRDGVKFCPWSISEAEKRLSGAQFYRSHRSYLINIQAVTGFEKNRDAGVCQFDGFTQLGNVPVSRARVGDLVQELGL